MSLCVTLGEFHFRLKTYCALVGGGGGIVPIGPDDIIGGTMGITGAASGSFLWLGCPLF